MSLMRVALAAMVYALVVAPLPAWSLRFYLGMMDTKCLSEDVAAHELIVGDFSIKPEGRVSNDVPVKITDPRGEVLFRKDANEGKFAFTASIAGEHVICFQNTAMQQKTVEFSFKTGVNAKDYTQVAKKDNLKPLEVELRRLEDATAAIHEELLRMKEREQEMREVNESTSGRVLYFCLFTLSTLMFLAITQILYLRNFFRTRKLID